MLLHVGIDDTDSPSGGCTTYIAALIVEELLRLNCKFLDYPNLIRLNPNAPWKTRGNGAICLRFESPDDVEAQVKRCIIEKVESLSEFQCDNTNPGIVFIKDQVQDEIRKFSKMVIQEIVDLKQAESLIVDHNSSAIAYKNRRGLIGALAAIGNILEGDHTYELLTYRTPENIGKKRRLDVDSVLKMDEAIKETFNNVDKETGQILITPRGPDPVLYGVRGETPESVYNAYQMIVTHEPVERWMIFRTNQGTNTHLEKFYKVSDVKPRYPSIISGNVTEKPSMLIGGHAIFTLHDESGSIDCVAYEPTGSFRDVVANLIIGDEITCAGGIRDLGDKLTLNLERIELIKLVKNIVELNPRCPKCGGPTESMGKSQGLRCKKCGFRDKTLKKIEYEVKRNLSNKCYIPPPRAQRHLTKPEKRYGNEQKLAPHDLFEHWHS